MKRFVSLRHLLQTKISDGPHETPEFVETGIPFLSVDNIYGGQISFENCRCISEEDHRRFSLKARPQLGDVLLTKAASVGRVAIVETVREFNVWSPIAIMRPNTEQLTPRFLYYVLQGADVQEQLIKGSTSSTQQNIAMGDLGALKVPLLEPKLQSIITDFLDIETARIDALIEKKRRMVDLVEEKLISTCETLLSSDESAPVRLKHFVMKVGSGSTPRGGSDVYVDSGVAFLRSQNIKDGQISHDDVVYITDEDDESLRRTRVKAGDVLLNITGGSIGRTAVARSHDLPANVSQHVCVIRPNPLISSDLLQAALDSSNVQEQIDLMQVGGNREGLNFEQIRNLMIVMPKPQNALRIEQSLIAKRIQLKKVKEFLLMQIDLLVIRRQALITAAVTGEIEVPEVAA